MDGVTIVYKGSSITLDEIMYLNKKKEERTETKTKTTGTSNKGKTNVLRKM